MKQYLMYIEGEFRKAKETIDSINPCNEEAIANFPSATTKDLQDAVKAARQAFDKGEWPQMSISERGSYLTKIASLIREEAFNLSRIETQDTGKTNKQTTFIDIPVAADVYDYFAGAAREIKGETLDIPAPALSFTVKEPVGVIGAIIPWNYPFLMAAWKIASSIVLGNTVVFKPSQYASLSCLELAKIIDKVGLPKGVVNIITGSGKQIGMGIAEDPDVDMISFTGSTEVGREIMKAASVNIKKLALELGGKSANIVFGDCNFDAAIGGTLSAIFMNQGQMCVAGSRLLVEDSIYDKFVEVLVEKTKKLKIGDSQNPDTDMGALVSKKQQERVLDYIAIGKKEAKLLCGGSIPKGFSKGFYVEPTIFSDVSNDMRIAQEEIFGPVLSVIKFSSTDKAIEIANDTKYGLAAMVWTKDLNKANFVSKKLRCGTVWVNTYGGFYNEAPFGGYKQSGIGRELGKDGLSEFTETKHINIDLSLQGRSLVTNWFSV
jgi:betaine-aldehyde dehydrogenase